ncbi:MAG: hypothetical protein AAGM22_21300 [Acidobacteriota bacterium]
MFFEVRPTDLSMLGVPLVLVLAAAVVAALPVVVRAVRADPTVVLRTD